MCGFGWSVIADAVIPVVVVAHVGVVVMVVLVMLVVHMMWVGVRVCVRGVVVLETACTAWLLSCEEAVAPTAGSSSSNSGSTIAATTAIVVIIAVDAHVPIQVSRLRESMVDDGRQLIKVQFSLARFFFKVFLSKEKLFLKGLKRII